MYAVVTLVESKIVNVTIEVDVIDIFSSSVALTIIDSTPNYEPEYDVINLTTEPVLLSQ